MKTTGQTSQDSVGSTGASVVITHQVREGHYAQYEEWLNEIGPLCKSAQGHLDWQIIRPLPGFTATYSVLLRFDSPENLRMWMASAERKGLIEKVLPLLTSPDHFLIRSGLDFWFVSDGGKTKVPVRWKQFLVTWSAIFPLSLIISTIMLPAIRVLGVPQNRYFDTFCVSGAIVFLMVYVVMPRYTRLLQNWLFR